MCSFFPSELTHWIHVQQADCLQGWLLKSWVTRFSETFSSWYLSATGSQSHTSPTLTVISRIGATLNTLLVSQATAERWLPWIVLGWQGYTVIALSISPHLVSNHSITSYVLSEFVKGSSDNGVLRKATSPGLISQVPYSSSFIVLPGCLCFFLLKKNSLLMPFLWCFSMGHSNDHKSLISLFLKRTAWCQVYCSIFRWETQNSFILHFEFSVGHCLKYSPQSFVAHHWVLLLLCEDFRKKFCVFWIYKTVLQLMCTSLCFRCAATCKLRHSCCQDHLSAWKYHTWSSNFPSEGNVIHFKGLLVCFLGVFLSLLVKWWVDTKQDKKVVCPSEHFTSAVLSFAFLFSSFQRTAGLFFPIEKSARSRKN